MSVCVSKPATATGERVLKMKGSSDIKCGRPQIIIVPPGFLKASSAPPPPMKIAKISPKEPLTKRPSVPLESLNPVRKRANLDHLSTEEKLLRRKLKNRVAAQNARDKKRVKMDEMEEEIRQLRERNSILEEENRRLRECRSRLEPNPVSFSLPLSPATSSSSEEEELSTIIVESRCSPDSMPSPPAERTGDDDGLSSPIMELTSFSCKVEEYDESMESQQDIEAASTPLFIPTLSSSSLLTPKEEGESSSLVGSITESMESQDLDTLIASQIEDPFNTFVTSELQPLETQDWEQSYNELFPDLI